jgi:hypothetical protein
VVDCLNLEGFFLCLTLLVNHFAFTFHVAVLNVEFTLEIKVFFRLITLKVK